jgi:hypothetical protein
MRLTRYFAITIATALLSTSPAFAQTAVDMNHFPWGVLGLLGLIGLFGRSRNRS